MGEILRAENISKTYQAGRVVVKALNRCSFSVERGEFVAGGGEKGAGKGNSQEEAVQESLPCFGYWRVLINRMKERFMWKGKKFRG